MPDPPYLGIWSEINAGKVVPFLGAGASIVGRAADATWQGEQSEFPPSGRELSHLLARHSSFPFVDAHECDDLAKVSSYYVGSMGRPTLRRLLRDNLARPFPIGDLHRLLAGVAVPQLIVVTNYDTMLERAFDEVKKPYDLVIHPEDRTEYANAVLWRKHGASEAKPIAPTELARHVILATTTVIYKIHGTLDSQQDGKRDNFVITEEDYVEFLARMTKDNAIPSVFTEHFRDRHFLFLGYSLNDWNLRVVLRDLLKVRREDYLPAWAIQRNPSKLECDLWERRNVKIFDQNLEEFVARMREVQAT